MLDRLIVSKARPQDSVRELSNKRALEIGVIGVRVIGVRSQFICRVERSAAIHPRILALPPVLMDNEIFLDG